MLLIPASHLLGELPGFLPSSVDPATESRRVSASSPVPGVWSVVEKNPRDLEFGLCVPLPTGGVLTRCISGTAGKLNPGTGRWLYSFHPPDIRVLAFGSNALFVLGV